MLSGGDDIGQSDSRSTRRRERETHEPEEGGRCRVREHSLSQAGASRSRLLMKARQGMTLGCLEPDRLSRDWCAIGVARQSSFFFMADGKPLGQGNINIQSRDAQPLNFPHQVK